MTAPEAIVACTALFTCAVFVMTALYLSDPRK